MSGTTLWLGRVMAVREAFSTPDAPEPAGTYSQAVRAGDFVYLAGQTPRTPDGVRHTTAPFEEQVRIVMENLSAVAKAAGASLTDAVKVTVYLTDPKKSAEFDLVYREYFAGGETVAARALVQSDLPNGDVEVDAVLFTGRKE